MVRRLNRRRDERGDLPLMTLLVMLLGSAVVLVSLATVGLASDALTAQGRSAAYQDAVGLGESAIQAFYSQLEANPGYFDDGGAWPGANGAWWSFGPGGQLQPCADVGGQVGVAATGGPGCWALDVASTTAPGSTGAPGPAGAAQDQEAATVTAQVEVDCHGTAVTCTAASVVSRFQRRDFLDYLYFTGSEQVDPAFTSSGLCFGPASCSEPVYTTGDVVDGPVHTNAPNIWACGTPVFTGVVEATGSPVWQVASSPGCQDGTSPNLKGGYVADAPALALPSSDSYLSALANQAQSPWPGQDGYAFQGNVTIVVQGRTLDITGPDGIEHDGLPFPSTGVVYASGSAFVSGSNGGQLTVAAGGDIYVTGDLTYACEASPASAPPADCPDYTGLVANGSVYLDDSGHDLHVDAAMVALSHSVSINPLDLGPCGGTCPTLTIWGALVGQYRGVYGGYDRNSGALGEGFAKAFGYDQRLWHHEPPWVLGSETGGWAKFSDVVVAAPTAPPTTAPSTTTTLPVSTTTTTVPPTTTSTTAPTTTTTTVPPTTTTTAVPVPHTVTFGYIGPATQSWTVPAGVTSVTVSVAGASGGSGYDVIYDPSNYCLLANPEVAHPGGAGEVVNAVLPVYPGQVLTLYVAGAGASAPSGPTTTWPSNGTTWAGWGYGSGGNSAYSWIGENFEGSGYYNWPFGGGAGGGSSAITWGNTPLVVAGGGAGAGGGELQGYGSGYCAWAVGGGQPGGNAGAQTGSNGGTWQAPWYNMWDPTAVNGGGGGVTGAPGYAPSPGYAGYVYKGSTYGSLSDQQTSSGSAGDGPPTASGDGGNGGVTPTAIGGGGGAGYYGGGGGAAWDMRDWWGVLLLQDPASGGGGGSSVTEPQASAVSYGANTGNGAITIKYTA